MVDPSVVTQLVREEVAVRRGLAALVDLQVQVTVSTDVVRIALRYDEVLQGCAEFLFNDRSGELLGPAVRAAVWELLRQLRHRERSSPVIRGQAEMSRRARLRHRVVDVRCC
jgi:hypothetical protein